MATLNLNTVSPGYRALVEATGIVDLSGRTQLELTGEDRATFLHNFCTNSVRTLPVGSGTEAFILDAKGHVLGHVLVFCGPSSIILDTVPGQSERLAGHVERYIIRENVEIHDRTDQWGVLLVAGPQAAALLESLALEVPAERLGHTESSLVGRPVYLRRVDLVGTDSWMLACRREDVEPLLAALANAGAVRGDMEAFEMARLEAGTPLYGRDITEKNLPQEVNRDTQAISFTKGCYLGQETVARIDALGHVNRVLVGVRFDTPEVPAIGTELYAAENGSPAGTAKPTAIGSATSAAYSPRLQTALALAYLRRGHTQPGTKLTSPAGPAEVVALPL
ncbi:MAG: glycine cleavage T C-terminal barrel domain-containing protein [Pirellulales bacterium]